MAQMNLHKENKKEYFAAYFSILSRLSADCHRGPQCYDKICTVTLIILAMLFYLCHSTVYMYNAVLSFSNENHSGNKSAELTA